VRQSEQQTATKIDASGVGESTFAELIFGASGFGASLFNAARTACEMIFSKASDEPSKK
jgi:hypothetical protein